VCAERCSATTLRGRRPLKQVRWGRRQVTTCTTTPGRCTLTASLRFSYTRSRATYLNLIYRQYLYSLYPD